MVEELRKDRATVKFTFARARNFIIRYLCVIPRCFAARPETPRQRVLILGQRAVRRTTEIHLFEL